MGGFGARRVRDVKLTQYCSHMDVPPNAMVSLSLDPADFALELAPDPVASVGLVQLSGAVIAQADGKAVARFQQQTLEEHAPAGHVVFEIEDPELALSDAVFLVAVLLFTDHHGNEYLDRPHDWAFVHRSTNRRFEVAHPPRIETVQALLARLPVTTRIRLLLEACEIAVPIWRDWAGSANLRYYDGIMAMDAVPQDLAEATISAVETWLEDAIGAPLEARSAAYRRLHWPMVEDELVIPQNVYYSAFAACNMARCALGDGDLALALVCVQQAAAARATNAKDEFLGEPFRRGFLLRWWRACLAVLCPAIPTESSA